MADGLKLVLPLNFNDTEGKLHRVDNYYGIVFRRKTSNNGGDHGYVKMIGDETLLNEMRFHNQLKIASVRNAETQFYYNQTNWFKDEDGNVVSLSGDDGSDVFQKPTKHIYAILGGTNPTYEVWALGDDPFSYGDDEAIDMGLPGNSPDYVVIKNGLSRSIYSESAAGTQLAGNAAITDFGTSGLGVAANNVGFPTTITSRYSYEAAARAHNSNTNKNTPYAPYNNFDLELLQAYLFIEFRTKQLNKYLGHGISSNIMPTANTWGKVTGARVSFDNGASYTYLTLGDTVYPTTGTGVQLWSVINGNSPLLKMFEAQRAVSNGATLETVYDSDGNAVQGLGAGVMTGIYTKTFTLKATIATTSTGTPAAATIDVVLRVPVWRGRTRLWGYLNQHISGYDILRYSDGTKAIHELYRAKSVEGLITSTDEAKKSAKGQFAFETAYDKVGTFNTGGWGTTPLAINGISLPIVSDAAAAGAGMDNYESASVWGNALSAETISTGVYQHKGALVGGTADGGSAVLRAASVYFAPSYASARIGSGLHVTANS